MCGRTGLCLNREALRCACSYKPKCCDTYMKPEWSEEYNNGKCYSPSYNIAPTDVTPVLISGSRFKAGSDANARLLKPMMWGIIPPWHTGDYKNHNLSTNNCRLENITNSKLYGPALRNGGRCIIVVEGFYEWQTTNTNAKTKQPYYIFAPQNDSVEMDDQETWNNIYDEKTGWKGVKLLHLAGVYSMWKKEDTIMYCYSVITMESNTTLDWLHHRMPAVLDNVEQIEAWLDVDNVNPDMALSYLKPVKLLSWYPVSTAVNNSRNKSIDCNKKISLEIKQKSSQKTITTWFAKSAKRKSNNDDCSEAKKPKQA